MFGLEAEKIKPLEKKTKYFYYDNPKLQWKFLYFYFAAFLTL